MGRKPIPEKQKKKQQSVYIDDPTKTELEKEYGDLTQALQPAIDKLPEHAKKRILKSKS